MELMTVVVVISILTVMVLGVTANIRARADQSRCVINLKNLYAAASVHIQQYESWPQIDSKLIQGNDDKYAQAWIDALKPCGLSYVNWLCPTIQREMGDPDMTDPKNVRVDYIANPFDSRPVAPYEYSTQPWFAERGNLHGEGNLVILTNGQILPLNEIIKRR